MTKADTNEQIRHAIDAWGYLVRWGTRLSLVEFAAAIRRHSTHARAEALAEALDREGLVRALAQRSAGRSWAVRPARAIPLNRAPRR